MTGERESTESVFRFIPDRAIRSTASVATGNARAPAARHDRTTAEAVVQADAGDPHLVLRTNVIATVRHAEIDGVEGCAGDGRVVVDEAHVEHFALDAPVAAPGPLGTEAGGPAPARVI